MRLFNQDKGNRTDIEHAKKRGYNHAAEVKVRAERKAGEMLAQLERGKTGGDTLHSKVEYKVTYTRARSDQKAEFQNGTPKPTPAHARGVTSKVLVGEPSKQDTYTRARSDSNVTNWSHR